MIAVGIDPGLSGAVAFIDDAERATVFELPTTPVPGNGLVKRRIDGRGLTDIVRANVPPGQPILVFIEMVRAMGGKNNAIQTQGSLNRTLGAIECVFDVMRIKPYMVEPQTWKRFYKLGKVKGDSLKVARKLYPRTRLPLAGDHNKAESILIAHWGRRTLL